jgi:uncharacterized membrane-anchored protein
MDGFMIFTSAFDVCGAYDTDTQCRLIGYMARYALTGEEPAFAEDDTARFVWFALKDKADRQIEAYERKATAGRQGGRRTQELKQTSSRSQAEVKQTESNPQSEAKPVSVSVSVSDTDTKETEQRKVKRFVAPTVAEVEAYIREKGYTVDAQKFVDYYESNGWRVGRNPMKDWKAALRTWQANQFDKIPPQKKTVIAQQYEQRDYSVESPEPMPDWMMERWKAMQKEGTA